MDTFEFFFAFYGLLLGLAVAELLSGFGALLREKGQTQWGAVIPILGVVLFVELTVAFLDAWNLLQGVRLTLPQLIAPTLIGVSYYAASVMIVPRRHADWQSLTDYFFAKRRWILGFLIFANLLIMIPEAPFVLGEWQHGRVGSVAEYALSNLCLFGGYAAAMTSRRPAVVVAGLVAVLTFFAYVYSDPDFGVLTPVDAARIPARAPAL